MAAGSEIRFRIGADTSSLQRGFIETETRAAQLGKALEKRLGAKDAFKGVVAGLGLGITEISTTIARAIAGLSEETEKSLNDIVASTARARQALDAQLKSRRTAPQNIEFNEADQRRLQGELANINALKPMRAEQRFISGMPGLGPRLEQALHENGFRTHTDERRAAEISAELQELAQQKEELENQKRDAARRAKDVDAARLLAQQRASGVPGAHDVAELLELQRQEQSLRDEAKESTTSAARREQLVLQADQLLTKQLEMQAHWRDANRAAAEKIQDIEEETGAMGETRQEHLNRVRQDALALEARSRDTSRSEDERRAFAVQAAEKVAAAAKAEYDWKVKTLSLGDALKTPGGRNNTTTQGVLARRATDFRSRANQARARGDFAEAVRLGNLADSAEDKFQTNDREGMIGALGRDPRRTVSGAELPKPPEIHGIKELQGIEKNTAEISASLKVVSTQ